MFHLWPQEGEESEVITGDNINLINRCHSKKHKANLKVATEKSGENIQVVRIDPWVTVNGQIFQIINKKYDLLEVQEERSEDNLQ